MKYKVGDIVRVRQWDDMVQLYGLEKGDIKIPGHLLFSTSMRVCCGWIFIVTRVIHDRKQYSLKGCGGYRFTDEMLEDGTVVDEYRPKNRRTAEPREKTGIEVLAENAKWRRI